MNKNYLQQLFVKARVLMLLVAIFIASSSIIAQTAAEKQALKVAQSAATLQKAKENLVKAERKVSISDSLVDVGIQNQLDGKDELKQLENELKIREKEYNTTEKALEKRMKSKDEVEFLQAQKELKEVDAKYKAYLKENDTKAKVSLKKETKGEADEVKGKGQKKPAEEGLLKAQQALEVAQAKYNMVTNTPVEKVEKSSKLTDSSADTDKKKKELEKAKDKEKDKTWY